MMQGCEIKANWLIFKNVDSWTLSDMTYINNNKITMQTKYSSIKLL